MNSYKNITSFRNIIAKQLYDEGIQQRTQVNSKFTPTLTILTAEIGAIVWLTLKAANVITESITVHQLYSLLFIAITTILCIIAIIYFSLCFTNYNFSYASPQKTKSYIEENEQYLTDHSEIEVLNNIVNNISNEYIDMAIRNIHEIEKHSKYLNKCYISIIATLVCMFFSFCMVIL